MTETNQKVNNNWTSSLLEAKEKVKITGLLTSQLQLRKETTPQPYYYAFIKLKGQSIDLPVIFKLKEDEQLTKPNLKKSDQLELTGHYSTSPSSIRKSFTCWEYRLLTK